MFIASGKTGKIRKRERLLLTKQKSTLLSYRPPSFANIRWMMPFWNLLINSYFLPALCGRARLSQRRNSSFSFTIRRIWSGNIWIRIFAVISFNANFLGNKESARKSILHEGNGAFWCPGRINTSGLVADVIQSFCAAAAMNGREKTNPDFNLVHRCLHITVECVCRALANHCRLTVPDEPE